jgi:hypothetical protein
MNYVNELYKLPPPHPPPLEKVNLDKHCTLVKKQDIKNFSTKRTDGTNPKFISHKVATVADSMFRNSQKLYNVTNILYYNSILGQENTLQRISVGVTKVIHSDNLLRCQMY